MDAVTVGEYLTLLVESRNFHYNHRATSPSPSPSQSPPPSHSLAPTATAARASSRSRSPTPQQQQANAQLFLLFESTAPPPITIADYATRLTMICEKNPNAPSLEGTLACLLIERLCKRKSVCVSSTNVHRLFLASMLVSIKYLNDSNLHLNLPLGLMRTMALLGGVAVKELARLEVAFLMLIAFNLLVDYTEYNEFVKRGVLLRLTHVVQPVVSVVTQQKAPLHSPQHQQDHHGRWRQYQRKSR